MIIFNFTMFVLIALGQLFIYKSVRENSFMSDKPTANDATIARRLTTVVLSDFLCWFPIGLLGVLASTGTAVSSEVNVAMVIFVLPLNSALNPFLYTLNTVLEKRRKASEARMMELLTKRMDCVKQAGNERSTLTKLTTHG
nr:hypothetical protein BaRGS_005701 [Batillaria attramentaria]